MRHLVLSLALLTSLLAPSLTAAAAPVPHTYVFVIGGVGTTVASTMQDFGMLEIALSQTLPAGSWSILDLSYAGLASDTEGWYAVPYSPCATIGDIWGTRDLMAQSLAVFAAAHPGGRIVLVGHSLGGFLAYYMATSRLAPAIAANVSIDAPLHGATELDYWADPPGCTSNVGMAELASRGTLPAATINADLTAAYNAGATSRNVGIVANMADCVYDLDLPNCPLFGSDWRYTMFAPTDWTGAYNDAVEGVGSITQQIAVPHAEILHNYTAMLAVARFLAR